VRGVLGGSGLIIALCLLLAGGGPAACRSAADKATGPRRLGCADAQWSRIGGSEVFYISFVLSCSGGYASSYTGTGTDQFGRTTGYNYSYGCQDGSERQTGSVSNIQYNDLGQVLGVDYSVNGQSCGHVTFVPGRS
jgi:hypothetical protein